MGSHIDRFIKAMHRQNAEQLLFDVGAAVRIRIGGEEKVILDQPVKADQINKIIRPVLEPADLESFLAEGEGRFRYAAPTGAVAINTVRRGDFVAAVITPESGSGEHLSFETQGEPETTSERRLAAIALKKVPAQKPPELREIVPTERVVEAPPAAPVTSSGPPAIDKILRQMVELGGSDLHISANHKPYVRRDGDMSHLPGWDVLSSEQIEQWMIEVAHVDARNQFYETHDADYAHEILGVARFRMNLFRDRQGVGAVMRQIPSEVLTAEQLALPPVLMGFCRLHKGLVTVTGPTGSGKSTTLAAMIDSINKSRNDHIITVEDPVEFVHSSKKCLVNQREVHRHTASFSSALRAALREDPDVVLVGEMRDLETVHIAIETAETGHLVFGTLHTNTAASTVDRIIDQFPTDRQSQIRVMLSESLKGVVSQTLCKKNGGGRVAALEILVVNNAVSNLIREGKTFQIPSIMQSGKRLGMQTQTDALMALVNARTISAQEAYAKSADQTNMKSVLERAGHRVVGE